MIGSLLAVAAFALAAGPAFAKPATPVVAILADPKGTEAVDALVPCAILAESGAVAARLVAATDEPVQLTPGMAWVTPQTTLSQLERERPQRADVVIVQALTVTDDPVRAQWSRMQARRGAAGGLAIRAPARRRERGVTLRRSLR